MKELELKYGCNPNQKPSRIYMSDGRELPIKVLCGRQHRLNTYLRQGRQSDFRFLIRLRKFTG